MVTCLLEENWHHLLHHKISYHGQTVYYNTFKYVCMYTVVILYIHSYLHYSKLHNYYVLQNDIVSLLLLSVTVHYYYVCCILIYSTSLL